jgi:hypothetical protein
VQGFRVEASGCTCLIIGMFDGDLIPPSRGRGR